MGGNLLTECPNHAGAYDCTPFCPVCFGEQEIEKKGKIMNKIYLARLELGNYLLTAWGETEEEAIEAIRATWEDCKSSHSISTLTWDWEEYAEHYKLLIYPMEKGKTDWQ